MIVETDGTEFEAIRSLNQALTFNYIANEFQIRAIEFEEAQKKTLGIINSDGIYTNLGLLISDQCLHTIKIGLFEGIDKSVFKDRREFGGSVLKQLSDTFEYIDLNNHTRAVFSGLNRIDFKDYSDSVIREALLNAIIHRDYSFSGSILVSIFDNRIEITSIGGLVPGLSIDDILLGISQSRNEKLADIFYRLRYVEAYGTGIGKIRKDYEDTNFIPEFVVTNGAFLLILPNKNQPKGNKAINNQAFPIGLDEELENRIINLITLNGSITRKELENKLGLKQTKTGILLRQMEAKRLITRTGAGKNTRYFIKNKN
jgi:ATP-dependent DNA helicase RecG